MFDFGNFDDSAQFAGAVPAQIQNSEDENLFEDHAQPNLDQESNIKVNPYNPLLQKIVPSQGEVKKESSDKN